MAVPEFLHDVDLARVQRRLFVARERLAGQFTTIERDKALFFRRGVAESSPRLQALQARRIQRLDVQAGTLARLLCLFEKQSQVLAHLVYARENADRLDSGLLATVDWAALLREAGRTSAEQNQQMAQLDGVLSLLNPPQPAPRPQVGPAPSAAPAVVEADWGIVTHIADGDGVRLADGRRVRYLGIDAPEMSTWDGGPQPFAVEAKELNRQLVVDKRVRLERDVSDTDRHGRLLRYVYVGDIFVNAEMVRAGLARAFTIWPDEKHAAMLLELEAEARRRRRGMWHGER